MLLSDLLHRPVTDADGSRVGFVLDVRFVLDGPLTGSLAAPRLHGIIVCPRKHASFLGYERTDMRAPRLVADFLRWRTRGTFLVLEHDVQRFGETVQLRPDATRWAPTLPTST
ncbi:PRC-barrel domain containing protein [Curtobacterium sp. MCSS17_008]|uniref:PRC-barrel domain-containing protein n=1 Tax=Curtobacterium sp. MCSS17_008 TaxID=2175647 RepID=UPI000DAA80AA|nr:PRC-barrel domain containing protein [Curtobacterium sp. MCSS17_008]PZF55260.1 PRC-barrel domain containing protein [Curtobacterium sp. MCSS17_008]